MCLLRDGRLVSGGLGGIVIYNKDSFQPDIIIHDYSVYSVFSVCRLRNGNLASGNNRDEIIIYEIDGNKHKRICIIKPHTNRVNKVIELEDGRLCSCSSDKTITIWDRNYQFFYILTGHTDEIMSIIEMNDYIISSTYDKYYISLFKYGHDGVRIWNKHTRGCIKYIQHLYCYSNNSLSKLGENKIILGGSNELFVLDILSFQYQSFNDKTLGEILCILVLREDLILLGNNKREIICYDSLYNQIVFTQSLHTYSVDCIIESEDKKIISSSSFLDAGDINIYKYL